jgi:hypothetical protein
VIPSEVPPQVWNVGVVETHLAQVDAHALTIETPETAERMAYGVVPPAP